MVVGVNDFKLHPIGNNKFKLSAIVYRKLYVLFFNNFDFSRMLSFTFLRDFFFELTESLFFL